jgi:hypothetical protein
VGTLKRRKTAFKRNFGCPLTRNNSPWCFGLCQPDEEGRGECGRWAHHAVLGRTQRAILKEKLRRLAEEDRPVVEGETT